MDIQQPQDSVDIFNKEICVLKKEQKSKIVDEWQNKQQGLLKFPALKALYALAKQKVYSDWAQNQEQVGKLAKAVKDQTSQKKKKISAFGGKYIV